MSDLAEDASRLSTAASKFATAKQLKETADQAFKQGNIQDAIKSYHQALLFVVGLDKNALQSMGVVSKSRPSEADAKETTEIDEITEKIYANMAACHLKLGKYQRALECANKALAKNENSYKAWFRKGKALAELGYINRAIQCLEDLKEKNPSDAAAAIAEIERIKAVDEQRDKAHRQKMKGFLKNKDMQPVDVVDKGTVKEVKETE